MAKELDLASEKAVVSKVDTAEVPSAEWGWSGESHKAMRIAAVATGIFLLLMIIGNHHGKVEDLYLIGFAVLLFGIVIRDALQRRKPR